MPGPSKHSSDNGQSAIARGMLLAHRASSMTMSLIVPVAAGYWADQKWGTNPWLSCLGGLIGFPLFLMQLIAFADGSGRSQAQPKSLGSPSTQPASSKSSNETTSQ